MENRTNPLLTQLEPIAMHGPIEIVVKVHVRVPSGKNATLEFIMPAGRIPAQSEIKEAVDACMTPESMAASSIPHGTRALTKPEFVEVITRRDTGAAIPMPGNQEWEPSTSGIPKGMLVHAICGAEIPENSVLGGEYVQRGLAYEKWEVAGHGDNRVTYRWNRAKLAELPEDMLLTIYKRVSQ